MTAWPRNSSAWVSVWKTIGKGRPFPKIPALKRPRPAATILEPWPIQNNWEFHAAMTGGPGGHRLSLPYQADRPRTRVLQGRLQVDGVAGERREFRPTLAAVRMRCGGRGRRVGRHPAFVGAHSRRSLAPLRRVRPGWRINCPDPNKPLPTDGLPSNWCRFASPEPTLERLEKFVSSGNGVSAGRGHELKTPIAELRSLAEVGLKMAGR